jgi:hypothetical protein
MQKIVLLLTIKCPKCGFQSEETMPTDANRCQPMPTDACIFFYECKKCQEKMKPLKGDCCVFFFLWRYALSPDSREQNELV